MIKYGSITLVIDDFDVLCGYPNKEDIGKIQVVELVYKGNEHVDFGETRLFTEWKEAKVFIESICAKNQSV